MAPPRRKSLSASVNVSALVFRIIQCKTSDFSRSNGSPSTECGKGGIFEIVMSSGVIVFGAKRFIGLPWLIDCEIDRDEMRLHPV